MSKQYKGDQLHQVADIVTAPGLRSNLAERPFGLHPALFAATIGAYFTFLAIMAATFSKEVNFFSIGTNDLIQYTLAVDRGNERVANLYTGASPAVIHLIKNVIRAAKRFDTEVSLCGEIGGDPMFTMLLIGLGMRNLSLVPSQIPLIKRVVRAVDIPTCERLARKVGSFDSERQVINTMRAELQRVLPEPGDDGAAAH